ncbi:hypothetical protein PsorP6_009729 [Peronosclerospora sorghi]|uniref:Uncharacterized protein n=1 Tax=Peronosclerospora sorghi TaxID=230839 RepID=A0ACC0W087_9STRA|nr:hypothetical protein PsorP6_009729 [Peronosclerospora sorghi]
MTREFFRFCKNARASLDRALEFLEQVETTMTSQVARSAEALGARADSALVGFLARMGFHVFP